MDKSEKYLKTDTHHKYRLFKVMLIFLIGILIFRFLFFSNHRIAWKPDVIDYAMALMCFVLGGVWFYLKKTEDYESLKDSDGKDLEWVLGVAGLTYLASIIFFYVINPSNTFTLMRVLGMCIALGSILFRKSISRGFVKHPKWCDRLINLMGVLISSMFIVIILESGTRLLIAVKVLPDIPHWLEINEKLPPNFLLPASYPNPVTPELKDEIDYFAGIPLSRMESEVHVLEDYNGEYFSIKNNVRTTTDQPENYLHTVYLFGGSTVFCGQTPDALTIASYLQRHFRVIYGEDYRVVNMGFIGLQVSDQNNLLRMVDLKPGDVVVYYDGVNNIPNYSESGLQQNHDALDRVYIKAAIDQTESSIRKAKILQALYDSLSQLSEFSELIYLIQTHNWKLSRLPVDDPVWLDQLITDTLETYYGGIIEAYERVTNSGAYFFHYMQPTLMVQENFTEREQLLMDTLGKMYSFHKVQDAILENNDQLIQMGIHSVDLTGILAVENRPGGAEVYNDLCHLNYLGNQLVADAIFDDLQQYLK